MCIGEVDKKPTSDGPQSLGTLHLTVRVSEVNLPCVLVRLTRKPQAMVLSLWAPSTSLCELVRLTYHVYW